MATHSLTSNTSTPAARNADYADKSWDVYIFAWGTWGGGRLTIEYSPDGVNFIPDLELTMTQDDVMVISIKPSVYYRATLEGAVSPDLNVSFV